MGVVGTKEVHLLTVCRDVKVWSSVVDSLLSTCVTLESVAVAMPFKRPNDVIEQG